MFGDSMFDEEDRLRRIESGQNDEPRLPAEDEEQDITAVGGLDERLRRRLAISQLLREVGGC